MTASTLDSSYFVALAATEVLSYPGCPIIPGLGICLYMLVLTLTVILDKLNCIKLEVTLCLFEL